MFSLLLATFFFALCFHGGKATIEIALEDAYVNIVDSEFFDPDHTEMFVEPNDEGINAIFGNVTIIKTLDPEITKGHVIIYELSMGKYNKRTGIEVTGKICEVLKEPVLVGPFVSVLGFSSCPPTPGVYETEGYLLPHDLYPDTFGENKFVFVFEIFTKNKTVIALKVFIEIIEID